jgi:hypothetical protein
MQRNVVFPEYWTQLRLAARRGITSSYCVISFMTQSSVFGHQVTSRLLFGI